MKLYRTKNRTILEKENNFYLIDKDWDECINRKNLFQLLTQDIAKAKPITDASTTLKDILPPVKSQEVWAAGVTYFRSKEARMDESRQSGADVFYDKVYDAERPEIFFKSTPGRVVGPKQGVRIRKDSSWNVPEPELAIFISNSGSIEGYTIGNDMSSRSIEGENPLYLPQAKYYDGAAALGPCLLVLESPISLDTGIHLSIERNGQKVFEGSATLKQMKRTLPELAAWLTKECSFPDGVFLMTGTCVVPSHDFTLAHGDRISITIDGIGVLTNTVVP